MNTEQKHKGMIGVFDSGVGGISVLKSLVAELPEEHFWYFGDSANAPYGEKSIAQVRTLAMNIADRMVEDGVKAIVIACNTATSAAVREIRERYGAKLPVIGIEPALKPAAREEHHGKILVMATPVTLRLEKYQDLSGSLAEEAEFIPVSCEGLAARIEQGDLDAPDVRALLEQLLGAYRGKVDGVVLGCTHYPFVKKQIREVLGEVPMFDGGAGTARELRRQLEKRDILRTRNECEERDVSSTTAVQKDDAQQTEPQQTERPHQTGQPQVCFDSSLNTPEELALYEQFFQF